MLQIRKIKPEDVDFILELAKESDYSRVKLLLNIENFLICESDSAKCGCGCLVPLGSSGLINWVMVAQSYRRKKLGGAITKALLNIADRKGTLSLVHTNSSSDIVPKFCLYFYNKICYI